MRPSRSYTRSTHRLVATIIAALVVLTSISIAVAATPKKHSAQSDRQNSPREAKAPYFNRRGERQSHRFVVGISKGRPVAVRQREVTEPTPEPQRSVEGGSPVDSPPVVSHEPSEEPGEGLDAPGEEPGDPDQEPGEENPDPSDNPVEPVDGIYVSPSGDEHNPGTKEAPLKSLAVLLPKLKGGETVLLEPGSYTLPSKDAKVRTSNVRVIGIGPTTASVELAGYRAWGGTNISFSDVRFTAPVLLTGDSLHSGYSAASADIAISESEITAPNLSCLSIFDGAHDIEVRDVRIFNCKNGIVGGSYYTGAEFESRDIIIRDSVLNALTGDGIHFGYWNDVRIEDNEIGNIADPAHLIHNDAIQLTGPNKGVQIARNHLHDSQGQLLFMRPNFGSIDDVLIESNLITGSGAVAVQSLAVTRARFLNNTIWDSAIGGLVIRADPPGGSNPGHPAATDTIVANNIVYYFALTDGAHAQVLTKNVIRTSGVVPFGNIAVLMTEDPGFADAGIGDFSLTAGSPAVGSADPEFTPATDLNGVARSDSSPSIGAIEFQGAH